MHLPFLLKLAATFLISYLSSHFAKFDISAVDDYRRLSRPPPPPPPSQIFFSTSADWADDYYLSTLANRTKTVPPSPAFDYTSSSESPADQDGSLPLRLVTLAAEVVVAFLSALVAVVPPAATTWALLGLRSRDLQQLRKATVLSLALFWEQSAAAETDKGLIARMSSLLERAANELAVRGGQLARAGLIKDQLLVAMTAVEAGLERDQRAASDKIKQATDERDSLRADHDALLRTMKELRARETARDATRRLTEATAKRQGDAAANRIRELEEEQGSALETTKKLEADLKEARELISSLQTTVQSNSQELHAHRARARAQHRGGYPAPFQPSPQQQYPQQFQPQGQYGLPPNRTSGFMGNMPPPGWGRGAGAGPK